MALSGKITALLKKIASDRVSGAAQIADLAVDCFLELPAVSDENTLRVLLRQLLASQPEMAPLYTLSMAAIEALSLHKEFSLPAIKEKALQFRSSLGASQRKIQAAAHPLFEEGGCFLTHSSSGTVKHLLLALHRNGVDFRLIATESRPLCEGRQLALAMGAEGIRTTLIVDAAAQELLSQATCVLLGADRISETTFTNKIGTRAIAREAFACRKPLYVVADLAKLVPERCTPKQRKRYAEGDILEGTHPNVAVQNIFFEETPVALAAGFITDEGLLSPAEVGVRAKKRDELAVKLIRFIA